MHASCVALPRSAKSPSPEGAAASGAQSDLSGVLIRGPSGAGKSCLALRLIAFGGQLVADDQTLLRRDHRGRLIAAAPERLSGLIEARGIGLLRMAALPEAPVDWVVDLTIGETIERLPAPCFVELLGVKTPKIKVNGVESAAAALSCLVRYGELLDPEADLADLKE